MVAALFTHPIDSLKVRLQLHDSTIPKIDFVKEIIKREGLFSLWRGLSASLLREATYSTLRVALYSPSKAIFALSKDPRNVPLWKKVGAGLISGGIGASITSPFDLLKIRFQAAKTPKGLFATGIDIYRLEGLKGLYRGVNANMIRASILTASQLASYDQTKQTLKAHAGFREGFILHCTASFIAGGICVLTTNPVVKFFSKTIRML
jgi:solute carrier family 25 (mitochondrial carrier), member 14/30